MEFGRIAGVFFRRRRRRDQGTATEDCKLITLQLPCLQSNSKPQLATAVFGTTKGVFFGTSLSQLRSTPIKAEFLETQFG